VARVEGKEVDYARRALRPLRTSASRCHVRGQRLDFSGRKFTRGSDGTVAPSSRSSTYAAPGISVAIHEVVGSSGSARGGFRSVSFGTVVITGVDLWAEVCRIRG